MAPGFYGRYVPPGPEASSAATKKSKKEVNASPVKRKRDHEDAPTAEDSTETKRRKREKKATTAELEGQHGTRSAIQIEPLLAKTEDKGRSKGGNGSLPARPKKKKDKRESQGDAVSSSKKVQIEDAKEIDESEQFRHQGMLSKFKKSKSAAEVKQEPPKTSEPRQPADEASEEHLEVHGLVPLPQPEEVGEDTGPRISALPDWLSKPVRVPSSMQADFEALNLSESILKAVKAANYKNALPVQSAVLPMLVPGPEFSRSDLCISAATGSGKTLAYTLPLIEDLKKTANTRLRAVIVVPTRELVTQVQSTFQQCDPGDRIRVGTASGNKGLREEQKALIKKVVRYDPAAYSDRKEHSVDFEEDVLEDALDMDEMDSELAFTKGFVVDHESEVDVLICTPGRLVEHLRCTRGFTLDYTRWLIIDEADSLLDQSFQEWTECVIPAVHSEPRADPVVQRLRAMALMSQPKSVRKIILSATMTKDVGKLAPLRLHRPKLVVVESAARGQNGRRGEQDGQEGRDEQPGQYELPATLEEVAISVRREGEKPLYILELLKDLEKSQSLRTPAPPNRNGPVNGAASSVTSSDGSESPDSSSSESDSDASSSESDSNASTSDDADTGATAATSEATSGMLVFTNSNESALRLTRLLSILKPDSAASIKSLTKPTGTSTGRKTINALSKGKVSVIIASDRASRGLDLPDLAQVISYDMPASLTSYIHRAGRTARANKQGRATTLVGFNEARWFWNEIARSDKVQRASKVIREDGFFRRITKEMSEEYEVALAQLGEEAGAT